MEAHVGPGWTLLVPVITVLVDGGPVESADARHSRPVSAQALQEEAVHGIVVWEAGSTSQFSHSPVARRLSQLSAGLCSLRGSVPSLSVPSRCCGGAALTFLKLATSRLCCTPPGIFLE